METLIKANESRDRWYPQPIDVYKSSINIPSDTAENKRLISNFAYSMQYLEYIEKQLDELRLSNVLTTMLYKSYIITGMGIIELLFVFILKQTGNWNKSTLQECSSFLSNAKKENDNILKVKTIIYKEVPSYDIRMDLDSMIKKVEKKHILTIDHSVFPALKKLRELRNRVHLQIGTGAYDHDYNIFGIEEIQMMRRILFSILTVPEFCKRPEIFDFINNIRIQHC